MPAKKEFKKYDSQFLREELSPLFTKSGIILAYLFGSQAKGEIGPMSDIDIAVLWNKDEKEKLKKSLFLQSQIKETLRVDTIEVGSLNDQALSFCFRVIKDGICIFGKEKDRVEYETFILNEYLDFSYLAEEYNRAFTQAMSKEK
ncbi:MAG: nucleotidyltransferase domain-containing protein [bacterium]